MQDESKILPNHGPTLSSSHCLCEVPIHLCLRAEKILHDKLSGSGSRLAEQISFCLPYGQVMLADGEQ